MRRMIFSIDTLKSNYKPHTTAKNKLTTNLKPIRSNGVIKMICDKCAGFGSNPYNFTRDNEGNLIHISCTEDCKNSIKIDSMVILQALICGFLGTSTYRQGKYNTLSQAANDALISCFGGSTVATFSEDDLKQILWNIHEFVGQIGYKSYVVDLGFAFTNETKNRVIVYKFPFGQIKQNLDPLTYNENIVDARQEAGEAEEEFYDLGHMCVWNDRMECNEHDCVNNLNSCRWMINIGLSCDYIFKYGKPFFNFFKSEYTGITAVCNDNGDICGLMHDMTIIQV